MADRPSLLLIPGLEGGLKGALGIADAVAMNLARNLLVIAPILALCVGGGLARRGHGPVGLLIAAGGVVGALALAVSGTWRPLLGLIAVSGFLLGIEADLPGNPGRRALGMLGIAVGLFALLTATFYA